MLLFPCLGCFCMDCSCWEWLPSYCANRSSINLSQKQIHDHSRHRNTKIMRLQATVKNWNSPMLVSGPFSRAVIQDRKNWISNVLRPWAVPAPSGAETLVISKVDRLLSIRRRNISGSRVPPSPPLNMTMKKTQKQNSMMPSFLRCKSRRYFSLL